MVIIKYGKNVDYESPAQGKLWRRACLRHSKVWIGNDILIPAAFIRQSQRPALEARLAAERCCQILQT